MSSISPRRQKRMDNAAERLFSRRDSIAVAGAEFQSELHEKLTELRLIWNEVGMTEEQRRDRMETALNHLKALLSEMVDEENSMRDTLLKSLATSKKEIDQLLKQMHQSKPAFFHDSNSLTLLDMEEKCRKLKEELIKERDARLHERESLSKDYDKYAVRLGVAIYTFDKNTIPEKDALEQMKEEVDFVKRQWESNLSLCAEKRPNIVSLNRKVPVDASSLTDFQRQFLFADDASRLSKLVLSKKHMAELEQLENQLKQSYEVFLEKIRQRMCGVQSELVKWWDQCHVPLAERERFQTVDPELDPERAVEQYKEAIAHWAAFYESRKTILDKIGEWERLWQEHVEFEEKQNDANRYNNRGGALLQEEKRRKRVQAMLPQVHKQLSELVAQYDKEHPGNEFLMDNLPVMEYISSIELDYEDKKRREKEEKEFLKRQQLMTERMYGTTPGSQKKRVGVAVTPSKLMSPSKKLLGQSKAFLHSSLAPRSPGTKVVVAPQLGTGSSSKKPPGLPVYGQSVKRKAFGENQDMLAKTPKKQEEPEHLDVAMASGGDDDRQSTASSTASYGEFAKVLRARGLEGQSSFIGGPVCTPTKMARIE